MAFSVWPSTGRTPGLEATGYRTSENSTLAVETVRVKKNRSAQYPVGNPRTYALDVTSSKTFLTFEPLSLSLVAIKLWGIAVVLLVKSTIGS